MPLLKEDKKVLAKAYLQSIDQANNAVVLSYKGIPVNELNAVRMDIEDAQGTLQAVKKRVLAKSVEGTYDGLSLDGIEDSLMVLYSHNAEDQHAPLKVVSKHMKLWKKAKKECTFDYVGGWYEKLWQSSSYVAELADLPSKEELLGKLAFLLNYPIASFARGLQAIADKHAEGAPEETTSETTMETASTSTPAEQEQQEEAQEEQAEQTEE